MTDRLVHLKAQLVRIQDDRRPARGALRRLVQRDRFLRDARGVLGEVQRADVLVALAREVSAERIGERPLLDLAVTDRQRDDAGARLRDDLLDARAFARREERVATPEVHRRLRDREPLHGLELGRRLQQQVDLLVERDGEGIFLDRGFPEGSHRLLVRQDDRRAQQGPGRAGDLDGEAGDALDLLRVHERGPRETPCAVDQDPHADAGIGAAADAFDAAVLDVDRFGILCQVTGVRVGRTGGARHIQRALGEGSDLVVHHGGAVAYPGDQGPTTVRRGETWISTYHPSKS